MNTISDLEISPPLWNRNTKNASYIFTIMKNSILAESVAFVCSAEDNIQFPPPDSTQLHNKVEEFVENFLTKTIQYFTTPLRKDLFLNRLRHEYVNTLFNLKDDNWYINIWTVVSIEIKNKEYIFHWETKELKPSTPLIPADFCNNSTPDVVLTQMNKTEDSNLRTVTILNTIESPLVQIGDLPLSDFQDSSQEKFVNQKEDKQRVREARLKVTLARLKAEREVQKYYSRYGEKANEYSDNSDLTSESGDDNYS